jgi:hypothetical protein
MSRADWVAYLDSVVPDRMRAVFNGLEQEAGEIPAEAVTAGSSEGLHPQHFIICLDAGQHHMELETIDGETWEWFYRDRNTETLDGDEGLAWGCDMPLTLIERAREVVEWRER